MRLSDLRRVTVRQGVRIRFSLDNGLSCAVNRHGIAEVEGIGSAPGIDLERELVNVREFVVEPAGVEGKGKPGVRTVSREELARMAGAAATSSSAEEHTESV